VQTVVVTLATAAAVTSGVLGVGLLVASSAPFDHAFAAQHGAHLTVLTDPATASTAQLAATGQVAGVTEASGPFAVAQVMVLPGLPPGETEPPPGASGPVLMVAARTEPGTGVDRVTLTDGRWAEAPDEAVLAAGGDFRVLVGETLTMGDGSGVRDVTVVGLARSVSGTADAWMTPGGLKALPATSRGYQMLYRLDDAGTASRVGAVRDAVAAALPDGAVTTASAPTSTATSTHGAIVRATVP
jgi:putative ABC transport system permease protein